MITWNDDDADNWPEEGPEEGSEEGALPSPELRTPDDYLNGMIAAYEKLLREVLRDFSLNRPVTSAGIVYSRFHQLRTGHIFKYPDVYDRILQLLQDYSQQMIDVLKDKKSPETYCIAAGLYKDYLNTFISQPGYDPEYIQTMLDANASWMLDEQNMHGDYYTAGETLRRTLEMQKYLLDKGVGSKQKIAEFVVYDVADFLVALPHATESGLHGNGGAFPFYQDERTERVLNHEIRHVYSYAYQAGVMYPQALDLIKLCAPKKGLPKFIEKTQPVLSVSLASKYEESYAVNISTLEARGPRRESNAQNALNAWREALEYIKQASTDKTVDFIGRTYGDFSEALIRDRKIGVVTALYDAAVEALPDAADSRLAFADAYAARNIYQMMKQEHHKEAGIFMNHLHGKASLQPSQMLLLLDVNKETIVGASVPLVKDGKVKTRASILFGQDEEKSLAQIVINSIDSPKSFISFGAKDHKMVLKDYFASQAQNISKKILAKGLQTEHMPLGGRWRAVDYRNV